MEKKARHILTSTNKPILPDKMLFINKKKHGYCRFELHDMKITVFLYGSREDTTGAEPQNI